MLKYRITSSLTADLTWRTDFAQTEVDDQQVDLERFPLFFPEKREFFQEGAGIFDFGVANQEGRRDMRLFHSRRIGLSPARQPIPIIAGGRITGRIKGTTLGMLNVQTEALDSDSIPASNYGVFRVKQDVLERSTIGGFVLNRELAGSNDFNRLIGLDSTFVFRRYFTLDSFVARSMEPDEDTKWVSSVNATWESDLLLAGMEFFSVDEDFRNDLGFRRRDDMRRYSPKLAFSPRPNIRWVRQMLFSARWDTVFNHSNELVRRIDHYVAQVSFQNGSVLRTSPSHYNFDRVERDFEISPGVTVPVADYTWNVYSVTYRTNPARALSSRFAFTHRAGYYGGDLFVYGFTPLLKLNEDVSFSAGYTINDGSVPDGDFLEHIVNARVNYNFTNQWLTSTTIQYNNSDNFFGVNLRLNYIFRPGDDFFLIYSEGRRTGGPLDGEKDRIVQAKLTYSFDF